ncbi:SH3 domain-containing protein [Azospirillum sp. HJ39]|uniref:SH3 domain-containing protein n=1 Tax=Azospirillum sp. HJ39 TaxID=3159496 RepID=UPI003556FA18
MRRIVLCAALSVVSAPVFAFDCPIGRGAEIYDGAQGAKLYAEPRDGAPVVTKIDPVAAVAVLETKKDCRLPKGWLRADHKDKSGYVREADLRPRVRFGMPE